MWKSLRKSSYYKVGPRAGSVCVAMGMTCLPRPGPLGMMVLYCTYSCTRRVFDTLAFGLQEESQRHGQNGVYYRIVL